MLTHWRYHTILFLTGLGMTGLAYQIMFTNYKECVKSAQKHASVYKHSNLSSRGEYIIHCGPCMAGLCWIFVCKH